MAEEAAGWLAGWVENEGGGWVTAPAPMNTLNTDHST